jgi:GNAT superfamily N-acetyltransferase
MTFVDQALARRFESAEELPQLIYGMAYQQSKPEIGAAVEEFCGGHMSFCGLGSPVGRAVGMGLDRPLTEADLDHIEEFYRAHKAPAQVDLTPLHAPEIWEMFKTRGYAVAELNNVLFRRLDVNEIFPPAPEHCEIRASRVEDAEVASSVVERAFFPDGAPPEYQGMLAPLYQVEYGRAFVAYVDGTMAACGTGLVISKHRIFAMCGAGTLTAYRGRGLQTALLRVRLKAAAEAGCDFAVVVTNGGSDSQRNCERLGFRVAYSKATVIKNL